jgi:tetratricopeptide (TPR) repeat protein/tRNA A-37 threonylcarbamoyl transferase component Bud32
MSDRHEDELMMDLLQRWEELRRQGRDLPAEELCGDPVMAAELGRRMHALLALEAPDGTGSASSSVEQPLTDLRPPGAGDDPPPNGGAAHGSRYHRLSFHARGGLGELFVARDEELNREVALKEIRGKSARDPVSRSRFLFEAEVTAGLEHPGIVPMYGLGQHPDGRPYYAMRLIRGESLKEAIGRLHAPRPAPGDREGSTRATRLLLRRFLAVCETISYAHSRGIIHRDLKPANIMLGPYGETLVVDWGLAKRLGQSEPDAGGAAGSIPPRAVGGDLATQPGGVSGTPAYMSPEQARGEAQRLGTASDIYNLGATLYCLLTGKAPFEGDQPPLLNRVRRGEFPPPRSVRSDVPRPLEAVCLKAMALRPEDRYATAQALADDVEKWLAGEDVSAYREPWTDRLRRWRGRHRSMVAAMGVGLVIAVLSLTGTVILLSDANRRERQLRAVAVASRHRAERAQGQALSEAARARGEARKAAALSNFLVQHFESSDPLGLEGQGFREPTEGVKELTAVQLLRRGAERIPALAEAGESEDGTTAVLMDTIGNSLRALGDYEHAQPLLEAALKMRQSLPGCDLRELGDSVFHIAILNHEYMEVENAERRYREAIEIYRRAGGEDSLAALGAKFRLAWLLAMERRVDEAEALLQEVLLARQAQLGDDHRDVQNVRLALILVMFERGNRMALLAQAQKILGHDNLLAGTALAYTRAMTSRLAHDYPDAKRQYENVLVTARKYLPARHLLLALLQAIR